ncbi:hypothetical protein HYW76_04880 [Candidatus Pacearchaeota archaeon]|nr:hypothetical protein [Candidatus Pacearchaeota archaeon]
MEYIFRSSIRLTQEQLLELKEEGIHLNYEGRVVESATHFYSLRNGELTPKQRGKLAGCCLEFVVDDSENRKFARYDGRKRKVSKK